MTALAAAGSAQTSSPVTRTWPPSGRSRPVIIDREVVFPAPFGPTSPAREPAAISSSIPATASFVPKLLRSPCTAMAGPSMSASLPAAGYEPTVSGSLPVAPSLYAMIIGRCLAEKGVPAPAIT